MEKIALSAYMNLISKEVVDYFDDRKDKLVSKIGTEDHYQHIIMSGKLEIIEAIKDVMDEPRFSLKETISLLKDRIKDIETIMNVFKGTTHLGADMEREFEARLVFGCKDIMIKIIEKFD